MSNIPGADPAAASSALSTALLPFVMELAGHGIAPAIRANAGLRSAVLLWKGRACHPGIAQSAGLPYTALSDKDLA